ncbi:MAG: helix-turn-helix transcriptional regulator [Muricomes sp.]
MERKQYPGINMARTGNWLRYICKVRKISVKTLCEYMGLGSPQSIYAWFCGRTLPSLDNFYTLSQILAMPLDTLIVNQEEYLPGGFCERAGRQNVRLLKYRMSFAS